MVIGGFLVILWFDWFYGGFLDDYWRFFDCVLIAD
jgi:hypothetical protein